MYFLIQEMLKTQNLLLITQVFVFIYLIYLFTYLFHFICFKVQQLQQNSTNVTGGANVVQGRIANYNKGFAARKALLGTSSTASVKLLLTDTHFLKPWQINYCPTEIELNIEIGQRYQVNLASG